MCNVVKFECGSLSSGWCRSPNTAVDQKRRCRAKLQHLGEVLPTNVFLLHEAQGARADALNKPNAPQKRPRCGPLTSEWSSSRVVTMCNVVKFVCGSLSSGWCSSPNTAVDQKRRCRAKLQHLGEVLPTNVFLLHEAQGARADALNQTKANSNEKSNVIDSENQTTHTISPLHPFFSHTCAHKKSPVVTSIWPTSNVGGWCSQKLYFQIILCIYNMFFVLYF